MFSNEVMENETQCEKDLIHSLVTTYAYIYIYIYIYELRSDIEHLMTITY